MAGIGGATMRAGARRELLHALADIGGRPSALPDKGYRDADAAGCRHGLIAPLVRAGDLEDAW